MMVTSLPSRSVLALPIVNGTLAVGVDLGDVGPADAEVDRALVLEHRLGGGLGRRLVGRDDHDEAGQRAGEGDVLDAHLRCAVFADRDAGVAADDLDVQVRIGDRHPQLVVGVAGDERGEAGDQARLARAGQAAGDADEVALGDADVEEPVGVLLAEPLGPGRVAHVGVDDDEVGMVGPEGFEGPAEGVARRLAQLSFRSELRKRLPPCRRHLSPSCVIG